jgi:23S rRNA (uracil1939-C5)-methyltransferase
VKLTIEKAIYGGAGLAHVPVEDEVRAGKAVFIPMTLPGEVVDAEIISEKKQFATARLQNVITPSSQRVTAKCRHYEICGGCDYQHAEYAAQLQMKQAILQETLERAGLRKRQEALPEIEVHASSPWAYRNRIRLHVSLVEGRARLGYTRAQSNILVPIAECPIAAELLVRSALAISALAYEDLAALDILTATHEVELFCDAEESAVQVTLLPHAEDTGRKIKLDAFAAVLKERVPQLQNLAWSGEATDAMQCKVGEEMYCVPQGAFFQVNRHLLPTLLQLVTANRFGQVAWDLYAGVGLFARVLARQFEQVEAVESSAAAAKALKENLGEDSGGKHRIHKRETLAFLMQAAKHGAATPNLIVADPPRAGLGADVCRLIAAISPREMVYVSCDPSTLGRDLAALMDADYRCDALHMLDMFPQTSHIEAMAVLSKS